MAATTRIKLTPGRVDGFACPSNKDQAFLRDSEQPGLALRVTAQLAEALLNPRSAADLMDPSTMVTPQMKALASALRAMETTGYRAAPVMAAQ